MKTVAEMTAEVREVNIAKGWRPATGGPGEYTWGDKIALLHSEISEALDAYRVHLLADATGEFGDGECSCAMSEASMSNCAVHGAEALPKPEGVGSELADVLIRLLDMADSFGTALVDQSATLGEFLSPEFQTSQLRFFKVATFGDHMAWLHYRVSTLWIEPELQIEAVMCTLVAVADKFGINLYAEYKRKVAYNRTRAFRHGGRAL